MIHYQFNNGWLKIAGMSALLSMHTALAETDAEHVYERARTYADLIACGTSFGADTSGDHIHSQDIQQIDLQEDYDYYLVLWGGDVGCLGGSSTYTRVLSLFSRFKDRPYDHPFLLDQPDIFATLDVGKFEFNPRHVEQIAVDTTDIIVVSGLTSEDDPMNLPSKRYRYTLRYQPEQYAWAIIKQQFMEDIKWD